VFVVADGEERTDIADIGWFDNGCIVADMSGIEVAVVVDIVDLLLEDSSYYDCNQSV